MMIRPRSAADLDGCVEALRLVHAADRYPVDWPQDPARWLTPAGLGGAWIAVEEEAVLGHAGLTADGEVTRLFVAPAGRGRGLAGRLLAAVRAAAGGPLRLEVSSEGVAAIALYERMGWRRIGSSHADWRDSSGEPALLHHYVSP